MYIAHFECIYVNLNQGWIRETCGLQLVKERTLCSVAVDLSKDVRRAS